jgi:hypothetical protein
MISGADFTIWRAVAQYGNCRMRLTWLTPFSRSGLTLDCGACHGIDAARTWALERSKGQSGGFSYP